MQLWAIASATFRQTLRQPQFWVILGVGLTRAFAASSGPDSESFHWLQATNIHLEDDPTWKLAQSAVT